MGALEALVEIVGSVEAVRLDEAELVGAAEAVVDADGAAEALVEPVGSAEGVEDGEAEPVRLALLLADVDAVAALEPLGEALEEAEAVRVSELLAEVEVVGLPSATPSTVAGRLTEELPAARFRAASTGARA